MFYVEKKSCREEWEVAIRAVLADGGGEVEPTITIKDGSSLRILV